MGRRRAGVEHHGAEAGGERLLEASERVREDLAELGQGLHDGGGLPASRQLPLEDPHEGLRVAARLERRLEPLLLEVALGRRLERALEDLERALPLSLLPGECAELEEDLAARDRPGPGRPLAAPQDREESPVALLGPVELPVVPREPGQRAQDVGVLGVDAGRRVELRERPRPIAHGELEARDLVVHRGPLARSPRPERLEHAQQEGARGLEAARSRERSREVEPDVRVVRHELAGLLEQAHRALGVGALLRVELGRLDEPREPRRRIRRVLGRGGHERREPRPGALLPVESREPLAHGGSLRVGLERALEPVRGAGGVARLQEGVGEAQGDCDPVFGPRGVEPALEPGGRGRRVAAAPAQARQRIERRLGRLERHRALVEGLGQPGIAQPLFGDLGCPAPARRGARGIGPLGALGLVGEQLAERAPRPPGLEEGGEGFDRLDVPGRLGEVRAERLDRARRLTERDEEGRRLEPQRAPSSRVGRRRDLDLAQREEIAAPP